jgi:Ca2+-binding RTX toxin-like protein
MIQSLERRVLLAVTAVLNDGTLTVTGTVAADTVRLDLLPGGSRTLVTVKSGNTTLYSNGSNQDVVEKLNVDLLAGNDTITFTADQSTVPLSIIGGEGADTIYGNFIESTTFKITGGKGDDKMQVGVALQNSSRSAINGSDGNDTIRVNNTAGPSPYVQGGAGQDVINLTANDPGGQYDIDGFKVAAGPGNDTIRGSNQEDVLLGEEGNDRIYGNGGDDLIYGGNGADILYGCVGNDVLDTGGGDINIDYTDGGDGNDLAILETGDALRLFNVEDVLA